MPDDKLTFSAWLDKTGLISKGKVFWLSDQLIGGSRLVAYPFLAKSTSPGQLDKGRVYLTYEACETTDEPCGCIHPTVLPDGYGSCVNQDQELCVTTTESQCLLYEDDGWEFLQDTPCSEVEAEGVCCVSQVSGINYCVASSALLCAHLGSDSTIGGSQFFPGMVCSEVSC